MDDSDDYRLSHKKVNCLRGCQAKIQISSLDDDAALCNSVFQCGKISERIHILRILILIVIIPETDSGAFLLTTQLH